MGACRIGDPGAARRDARSGRGTHATARIASHCRAWRHATSPRRGRRRPQSGDQRPLRSTYLPVRSVASLPRFNGSRASTSWSPMRASATSLAWRERPLYTVEALARALEGTSVTSRATAPNSVHARDSPGVRSGRRHRLSRRSRAALVPEVHAAPASKCRRRSRSFRAR